MQHNLVKAYALPKTFQKLTKLLLVALFCGVMGGCGLFDDWTLTSSSNIFRGGGVVNDTSLLFLQYTEEHWEDDWKDKYEIRDHKLLLGDILPGKTYWEKNIVPVNTYIMLNFIDSTLFFFDKNIGGNYYIDKIMVRKLVDKEFQQSKNIELKFKNIELKGEGWEFSSDFRIRPWHSGLILANRFHRWPDFLGGFKSEYALIDTTTGTFERFTPSGEFEWMDECEDVKWSFIGGLCLKVVSDTTGFILLKNGVDTLAIRYNEVDKSNLLFFTGNGINSNNWIYLMNNQGEVSENPLERRLGW